MEKKLAQIKREDDQKIAAETHAYCPFCTAQQLLKLDDGKLPQHYDIIGDIDTPCIGSGRSVKAVRQ